jgi:hypothetical protein
LIILIKYLKGSFALTDKTSTLFNVTYLGLTMSEENVYFKECFYKFLVSLEELKEKKNKFIFMSSVGISEDELNQCIQFLHRFDIQVQQDDEHLYPLTEQYHFKLDLSLSEWFAFQMNANNDLHANLYFEKIVKNKIKEAQMAYSRFHLFRKENSDFSKSSSEERFISFIESSIIKREVLKLSFHSANECDVFPHRIVFLDGVLCLVGEDLKDKALVFFAVEDFKNIEKKEHVYEPNLSQIEVNDFIGHLRLINGNEERLILKIYSSDQMDLLPAFHYLGNPFITSNSEGDMIWAASIEICEDVYKWLYKLKDRVEILDPGHVRKDFAHFCELKKQSSFSKKAS